MTLNSQLQAYQILTTDDQMLILSLSYFITKDLFIKIHIRTLVTFLSKSYSRKNKKSTSQSKIVLGSLGTIQILQCCLGRFSNPPKKTH